MKTPHASPGVLTITHKSPPCLMWITPNKLRNYPSLITKYKYLPYFIIKIEDKLHPCPVANKIPLSWLWLSTAYSDIDPIYDFCWYKTYNYGIHMHTSSMLAFKIFIWWLWVLRSNVVNMTFCLRFQFVFVWFIIASNEKFW